MNKPFRYKLNIFLFLLPALIGADGIWLAVDAADFCCLVLCVSLILGYRKKYGY